MSKRPAAALVSYASSDDDEENNDRPSQTSLTATVQPPPKKRKLPPISTTIVPPGPVDDPSLHQGRIRTTPHIEGQFSAHVYVALGLKRDSPLHKLVRTILSDAKEAVPTLHEIWKSETDPSRQELHLSLSRPISLRAHQREDLKRAVKNIAKTHKAFTASFATLSELINDEKTRSFLTMELGAGYQQASSGGLQASLSQMSALADALTPALQAIRQQLYYVKPRFHASIGWALLHAAGQRRAVASASELHSDSICTPSKSSPSEEQLEKRDFVSLTLSSQTSMSTDVFPTIECLPADDVQRLNNRYGPQLSAPKLAFDVHSITLKIGKDAYSWKLIGTEMSTRQTS
ncbi:hypothetical protein D9619_007016 [Psilocybe cf. subviscida]|uniref:U6 snRNA phosphodiesterase 1 n=1 Tax=Psilocybe cf. subviscida TaxID=2480587 RepID=A0A8H5B1M6_9AGAR|nr:hypothetical protein D9619_007016 [Psilocybe cf. subviscida]